MTYGSPQNSAVLQLDGACPASSTLGWKTWDTSASQTGMEK